MCRQEKSTPRALKRDIPKHGVTLRMVNGGIATVRQQPSVTLKVGPNKEIVRWPSAWLPLKVAH